MFLTDTHKNAASNHRHRFYDRDVYKRQAVVSPIGELCYKDVKYTINGGKIGEVTQHLYDTLTGIQWGRLPDTKGWTYPIK